MKAHLIVWQSCSLCDPNQRVSGSLEALENCGDVDVLQSDGHGADKQSEYEGCLEGREIECRQADEPLDLAFSVGWEAKSRVISLLQRIREDDCRNYRNTFLKTALPWLKLSNPDLP